MAPPSEDTDNGTAPNDWDSDAYDGSHSFVFEYGEGVVGLLDPQPSDRVLDLGCGTGHLTAAIADTGARVVGVDRAATMLADARTNYPSLAFVRGDARELPFAAPFDAVFSNAALHWIPGDDHGDVLDSVSGALRPGGRFVAELGGAGNVSAIVDAVSRELESRGREVENPWYFPTVGEYASRLEARGFEVRYAAHFDRPTELDGGDDGLVEWLGMFGDSLLADVPEGEHDDVLAAVADDLRDELYEDGTWTADYRRLRFEAVRTDA
ncbi:MULTISPECIES: trans-aconitate 2-methyltransferase [Halobacterium]|uniref:class I SAM-dependent methyltransferase n=1 Tax=Halobacterium TaxID=2239 RepID=UPI00073ECDD3|nr:MULTISPECIES: class I SAM-dependent methyltransferase [Halobacterium]MCG1003076.1 methyltransferase domain-containing protein [Halobacterium noricense]